MPVASPQTKNQVVSFSFNKRTLPNNDVNGGGQRTISLPISHLTGNAVPKPVPEKQPHLVPVETPRKSSRNFPFLVRINKCLQTTLVALCGFAICAYGLDVVVSHDVGKLQGQARTLSEQNSELSAQLLKSISYGELKDSVVGRFGLRVPDHVHIVKKLDAPEPVSFKSHKHDLPMMSGY